MPPGTLPGIIDTILGGGRQPGRCPKVASPPGKKGSGGWERSSQQQIAGFHDLRSSFIKPLSCEPIHPCAPFYHTVGTAVISQYQR